VHKYPKFPFISNLKKPGCGSKQDVLKLATLRYLELNIEYIQTTILLVFQISKAKKN
jgi:hypothetical protein